MSNFFIFFLDILRMDWQNLTKFCIHIIIDKALAVNVLQICNSVTALDFEKFLVFVQYLENGLKEFNQILYTHYHWQYLFLVFYIVIFSQIWNGLTALYWCQKLFLLNILRMDGQN